MRSLSETVVKWESGSLLKWMSEAAENLRLVNPVISCKKQKYSAWSEWALMHRLYLLGYCKDVR